jgi:hypothetical protein
MTPRECREHALKCRAVAETIQDEIGRRILLEAADDYQAMARRLATVVGCVPAKPNATAAASAHPS